MTELEPLENKYQQLLNELKEYITLFEYSSTKKQRRRNQKKIIQTAIEFLKTKKYKTMAPRRQISDKTGLCTSKPPVNIIAHDFNSKLKPEHKKAWIAELTQLYEDGQTPNLSDLHPMQIFKSMVLKNTTINFKDFKEATGLYRMDLMFPSATKVVAQSGYMYPTLSQLLVDKSLSFEAFAQLINEDY